MLEIWIIRVSFYVFSQAVFFGSKEVRLYEAFAVDLYGKGGTCALYVIFKENKWIGILDPSGLLDPLSKVLVIVLVSHRPNSVFEIITLAIVYLL